MATIPVATAMAYLAAGLSCLPAAKAKKRPAIGGWKTWQTRLPTKVEVKAWFSNPHDAICVVSGEVSGNLECMDFDQHGELFAAWMDKIDTELLSKLVIEQTPSGGYHVFYRVDEGTGNGEQGVGNGEWRPGARTFAGVVRRIDGPLELRGTRLLSGGIVPGPGATVTMEEIEQGYRLVSETNEPGYSFAMPTNALHVGNLHLHGARTDLGVRSIDLGTVDGVDTGWAFPYGADDSAYSSFWWFMDGRLQDRLRASACAISAGIGDALAMQGESRVWMWAEDGTRTVTWERFFAGGDTNAPVNAQISLKDTGTFIVRSNDNVRVYRRIDENDWDGDGLDNLIDDFPFVAGEDCHGTGAGWLNANCGAILSASTDQYGDLQIEWNQSANENAYYWLYFTALRDGTRVTVECDGSSDLGDLVIIADEGQSCEVPLLMGPSYHVMASWPIADISSSDYGAVLDFGGTRGGVLAN